MAIFGSKRKHNNAEDNKARLVSSGLESAAALSEPEPAVGEELAAAITGALMSFLDARSAVNFRVKSIRRIGRNTPVWNTAGRDEHLASKL